MPRQIAAVVQDAQHLDPRGGQAKGDEVPGRLHYLGRRALTAPVQVIEMDVVRQARPLADAGARGVGLEIAQRLLEQRVITKLGRRPEFVQAVAKNYPRCRAGPAP